MGTIYVGEQAAPSTPPAAQAVLYVKSDGLFYWKDDAGTEYPAGYSANAALAALAALTPAADKVPYFTSSSAAALADFTASGRSVVGLTIAAAGDIYQGTAAGAAGKLALGTAGTRLHSTGTLAEWQGTWFKVGNFTRDFATASGSIAITGVGFKPKAVIFIGGFPTTTDYASIGFDSGSAEFVITNDQSTAGRMQVNTSRSILFINSAGAAVFDAFIASLDTDGFTLTAAKTGSPTGVATIGYLAFR